MIIGSSPHLFAALSARLLAKKHKVPFVFEVRDIWPETLILLGSISPKNPAIIFMRWIEKYLCKNADAIITLLPDASKHVVLQGAQLNKIFWLPNFIDLNNAPTNLHASAEGKSNQITFMYAGTHGLANNLRLVLQAALILQREEFWKERIRIVLVGEGPEKKALSEQAKLDNIFIVSFYDRVPKSELYSILTQADAFLMLLKPSTVFKWGVSPNKLFDYMLMAKPIIFGVSSSNNPVFAANAGITINPESPQELADAMKQIAAMSLEERNAMGMRGYVYVKQHHNLESLADKLEKILNKVSGL